MLIGLFSPNRLSGHFVHKIGSRTFIPLSEALVMGVSHLWHMAKEGANCIQRYMDGVDKIRGRFVASALIAHALELAKPFQMERYLPFPKICELLIFSSGPIST